MIEEIEEYEVDEDEDDDGDGEGQEKPKDDADDAVDVDGLAGGRFVGIAPS